MNIFSIGTKLVRKQILPLILTVVKFIFDFIFDRIWNSSGLQKKNGNTDDKNEPPNKQSTERPSTDGIFPSKFEPTEDARDTNTNIHRQRDSNLLKKRIVYTSASKNCLNFMNKIFWFIVSCFLVNLTAYGIYNFGVGYHDHKIQYEKDQNAVDECRVIKAHGTANSEYIVYCNHAESRIQESKSHILAGIANTFAETKLCGNMNCLDFMLELSPHATKLVGYLSLCTTMIMCVLYFGLYVIDRYTSYRSKMEDNKHQD